MDSKSYRPNEGAESLWNQIRQEIGAACGSETVGASSGTISEIPLLVRSMPPNLKTTRTYTILDASNPYAV